MLRPFAHLVRCCCTLLRVVGSCCAKFETGQKFSQVQTDATTPNIVGPKMFGSCCIRLQVALIIWNMYLGAIHSSNSDRSDYEKWSTSKSGPVLSKRFRSDRTDPSSFGPNRAPQFLKLDQVQGRIPCWSRALFVMDINNRQNSFDLAAWFSLPTEISSMTQN